MPASPKKIKKSDIYFSARLFIFPVLFLLILAVVFYEDINPFYKSKSEIAYQQMKTDYEWAHRIMKGGYILHFRHAERHKWIDVEMYDLMESDLHQNGINQTRFAEDDYFSEAVCLNERGKIQAKAMGEHLKQIRFPVGHVISSPSCRSRQTALLAFGGLDKMHRLLVHKGPYFENEDKRIEKLKKLYAALPEMEGKNIIVSAHNSVAVDGLFENKTGDLDLEEGGFYVISKRDGKLYLDYEFHNFLHFIRAFYNR